MKKLITLLIVFLSTNWVHSQAEDSTSIQNIEIYLMKLNKSYLAAQKKKTFAEFAPVHFTLSDIEFHEMFEGVQDQREKLTTFRLCPDSIPKNRMLHAMVQFHYSSDTLTIFFDRAGNYLYESVWHDRNNEMFVLLFKYFSNELISEKLLAEAKKNYRGKFWYD